MQNKNKETLHLYYNILQLMYYKVNNKIQHNYIVYKTFHKSFIRPLSLQWLTEYTYKL